MVSIKKISIIVGIFIVAGSAFFIFSPINFYESSVVDNKIILQQIKFNAIYLHDEKVVRILFEDSSNNTKSAVLEILGMDVTYHKEYYFDTESSFITEMSLEQIPKYGWKTTPVTLEIQHIEFGKIGLKTEITEPNQDPSRIIVEQK